MSKAVFVITGLGEGKALSRVSNIVEKWNDDETSVHIFDSKWESNETLQAKRARLVNLYDEHKQSENFLVAYSAGGALATNLFLENQDIKKAILICCKIKGSETIGQDYQKRAVALLGAVEESEKALKLLPQDSLGKIICFKPIIDQVVPKKDMSVPGTSTKTIPFIFHAPSIGYALLFQSRRLLS